MAAARVLALIILLTGFGISAILGEEVPPQFKVWADKGPPFAPAPEGAMQVSGDPGTGILPAVGEGQQDRGLIVFKRHPQVLVYQDSIPASHEIDRPIRAFAVRGEYEPLAFGLHGLADLKNCTIQVEALAGPGAATISRSHIDIRLVRSVRGRVDYRNKKDLTFKWKPFLLEKHPTFDLGKGKTKQVWLTVKIPADAAPGDYRGTVTIRPEGKAETQVPVLMRVLPLVLPPIPIRTTMAARGHRDPAMRDRIIIDLIEHGINSFSAGVGAEVVSRDRDFGADDAAATIKTIRTSLALRRKYLGEAANHIPVTASVGHQILYYWDQKVNWFRFWPEDAKMEADFYKAIQLIVDTVKAEKGPPLLFFVMDEPGGHPENLKDTAYWNEKLKAKFPRLRTTVTIGGGMSLGIDEIGILGKGIDEFDTNRFSVDICKRLTDMNKTYGVYNGGGATEAITSFARDRYFFGFYAWKTDADKLLQWVHSFGKPWADPFRGNHGYVYLTDDGIIPSIPWECVREGLDDYRYMDLLWRFITAARKSGKAEAIAAAAEAEEVVLAIMRHIDYRLQGGGSPSAPGATLDIWRWQTAQACLRLMKHIPLAQALTTAADRPDSLHFPQPGPRPRLGPVGPELLVNGGFEGDLKPWKHSGKNGAGQLDTIAHTGAKSFRLEAPADVSGNTVNVCVWGWGGPGPSMTLKAGKTYELSAWIKTAGMPPQLRLNLPKGSYRLAGKGPVEREASGWTRHSLSVVMTRDAKPGYIAVWLQGPGALWCDDLSLREFKVPPFEAICDRSIVDGRDRNVIIRVQGTGEGMFGKAHVLVPGGPSYRVVLTGEAVKASFDAAALKPGMHTIIVKAADGDYQQELLFERVIGPFDD